MTTMRHPKNQTRFKSLDAIAAHEAVERVFDEGEDGLWIWLKRGWWTGASNATTALHEYSVKDLIEAFKGEYKPERCPQSPQLRAGAFSGV